MGCYYHIMDLGGYVTLCLLTTPPPPSPHTCTHTLKHISLFYVWCILGWTSFTGTGRSNRSPHNSSETEDVPRWPKSNPTLSKSQLKVTKVTGSETFVIERCINDMKGG